MIYVFVSPNYLKNVADVRLSSGAIFDLSEQVRPTANTSAKEATILDFWRAWGDALLNDPVMCFYFTPSLLFLFQSLSQNWQKHELSPVQQCHRNVLIQSFHLNGDTFRFWSLLASSSFSQMNGVLEQATRFQNDAPQADFFISKPWNLNAVCRDRLEAISGQSTKMQTLVKQTDYTDIQQHAGCICS